MEYVYSPIINCENRLFCQEFGVKVVAIDLSSNMIKIGMERAEEVGMSPLQVMNDKKSETFCNFVTNTMNN